MASTAAEAVEDDIRHVVELWTTSFCTPVVRFLRLVIPASLRHTILNNLHAGHQGRDSMLQVEQKCRQCQICEVHAPSQPKEELIPTPPPQYLFQQVAADLFHLDGNLYIAYADRLTSSCLITTFRQWFRRLGIPEELSCDGGTNLTSHESRCFFSTWCVKLRISSAHYAQSNGRTEAAVKSAKRLLRGNISRGGSLDTDITRALMQYLNTPLQGLDTSPSQLLIGRQLRDAIPVEKAPAEPRSETDVTFARFAREVASPRQVLHRSSKAPCQATLQPPDPGVPAELSAGQGNESVEPQKYSS
ncbi:uncharacterized protein K02A2.6-like [Penaeus indicus]|uniref:uncharacterized protein K02A2.6-like n=1 Tax=Penaeus indicus TaxID=29960 RepID=UPI00300C46B9